MAFGKKEESKEKKEARSYTVKYYNLEKVTGSAVAKESTVTYTIADGVELTINAEKMWCQVNFCGLSFFTQIKERKEGGYFLSFPSRKRNDDSWEDVVTMYDKNFHTIVKELLGKIAES